jgi:hypothetical protein
MRKVLDGYTREQHLLWVDRFLKSAVVIEPAKCAVARHGAPEYICSDIGSEFCPTTNSRAIIESDTDFSSD